MKVEILEVRIYPKSKNAYADVKITEVTDEPPYQSSHNTFTVNIPYEMIHIDTENICVSKETS